MEDAYKYELENKQELTRAEFLQKQNRLGRILYYKRRKESEMSDIIFVDGVKVKQKFDGLLGVSIKVEDFAKFVKANTNENGYLNIDICKSKDKDAWYAKLNTWKPEKREENQENIVKFGNEEIPF